ncbi:MAG: hypothetical protein ACP5SH_06450 [Syntrophobacteraceae bacterium]
MTLKENIDALKAKSAASIPREKQEVMHRAIEELERSGLVEKAPKAGDRAPDFSLKEANGALVSLDTLLEEGPVVLSFFRGGW